MTESLDALGGLVDAGLVATVLGSQGKAGINAAEVADAHHECANCGRQAHVHRSLAHFDGNAW